MAVSLKHAFQSARSDGGDDTLVQPSDWNAEHALTLAAARLLGRTTAGTGAAEEISVSPASALAGGVLTAGLRLLQDDVFTASGTWTRHADARLVVVELVGGGGGGGSGAAGDDTAPRCGGGGGAGGGIAQGVFPAADLGATESVVVAASAAGGAASTGDGNAGTNGNLSLFGAHLMGHSGRAGGGGTTTAGAAGLSGNSVAMNFHLTSLAPGRGSVGSTTRAGGSTGGRGGHPWASGRGPGGGSGGAGLATTDAADGTAGGWGGAGWSAAGEGLFQTTNTNPFGGNPAGSASGLAGESPAYPGYGAGGNGGAAKVTTDGEAGGGGGAPGGGGAGGGAARGGFSSGAGGDGARGEVRVRQYG